MYNDKMKDLQHFLCFRSTNEQQINFLKNNPKLVLELLLWQNRQIKKLKLEVIKTVTDSLSVVTQDKEK